MKWSYPEKGFALILTIVTLLTISILVSFSIRAVYSAMAYRAVERNNFRARLAAESGVAFAQARLHNAVQMGDVSALNHARQRIKDGSSFQLQVGFDRGFVNVRSQGQFADSIYVVEALIGSQPSAALKNALVIESSSHELYASGSTSITGNVLLPNGFLIPKSLHGESAAKQPIVQGEIRPFNAAARPQFKWLFETHVINILKQANQIQYGMAQFPNGKPQEGNPELRVLELEGQTLRLKSPVEWPKDLVEIRGPGTLLCKGDLILEKPINLTQNVWLVVDGKIEFSEPVWVEASLIASGTISSRKSLKGSGCLMSLNAIQLNGDTQLHMPTTLMLSYSPELSPPTPKQIVVNQASIVGLFIAWQQPGTNWNPRIQIGQGCDIKGYIFTNGQTELLSPITGVAYTHEILSHAGAQPFLNWLKSIQIDRDAKAVHWALPPAIGGNLAVAQWIKR